MVVQPFGILLETGESEIVRPVLFGCTFEYGRYASEFEIDL